MRYYVFSPDHPQVPTKIELTINLKTAKALVLPHAAMLARTDEAIE
jgi:hypothetical protein